MRLAAQEKVGFYPTPAVVVELLSSWLKTQGFWRLLDPCCGAGEAAALLAERIGGEYETWGVEIAPERAAEAASRLSRVYNAAWQHVRVEKGTVSLLWLNPPYDYDDHDQRTELEFLRTGIPSLVRGGVLVYIVPQRLLGYKTCAQALAGHFEQLVVRRFPGETYDLFRQVVVLGRKRQTYHHPTEQEIAAIRSLADGDLEELTAVEEPKFSIPTAPRTARFSLVVSPANLQVASAAAMPWPEEISAFLRHQEQDFRPALPLRKGHVAMLMSGGLLGKVRLTDPDGSKLLAKGRVVKQVDTQVEEEETGDGRPKTTVIRRERFATTVVAVKETGEVVLVEDTDRLTEFMEQYGAQLAEQILRRKPLYDLQPTREEWETVSALGKNRKPLPGQKDAGLLDVQKHVAIGAARVCRKHRSVIIQGEMGVGKTTIGLAALELLDGFPAIVLCPPHLAPKWCREAQEVLPDVHVAEIRSISDVDRLVEGWKNGVLGKRFIAVLASTTAKLGSGWKNTPAIRYTLPEEKAERKGFLAALRRYKALRAQQGDPEEIARARREAMEAAVPYPVCPRCGSALMDEKGNPVSVADLGRKPLKCTACGAPLYDFGQGNYHRWPIAEYISRKHRGVFRTLVADEVHEYKSRDSDRGLAFQRLVGATRYHLALTGTLYGGKATSIFWLLHRLGVGNVQRDFAYDDERRWVDLYGVWETREVYTGKAETYGVYNATCRRQVSVQEKPGVSPAILPRIIGQTIFVDLADLGVALPPYQESYGPVAMTDEQEAQYRALDSTLRSLAVRDRRYLSIWLQWTLSRPNSAFRDEAVVRPHVVWEGDGRTHAGGAIAEVIFDLPAVVEDGALLPKEAWLANFVQSEALLGRKSLVYVRQSDTRDIQPRLRQVLEQAGVRVAILKGTDPRRREEWIAKNVDGIDCLLCNPLLVQTGLDLVGFCNAVYYEPQYSLYVLWQSMRRVWRLGQTNPVKVVFLGYKGTMEEAALRLIGLKIRAAQLLFGKEVVGAIVPEDDGNFLYELARTVLEGKELPDLTTLFAARVVETPSPLGSPTVPSPEITIRVSAPYRATQAVLPGFEGIVVGSPGRRRR